MLLNKTEGESLWKRVKSVIPQMKKSEIVNHLQNEGYLRRAIYNNINRLHNEEWIEENKKTDSPTSLASTRKNQLKRLINNPKGVCQRRLGRTLSYSQVTICRQISKILIINVRKYLNTPRKGQKKQRICARNLPLIMLLLYEW
jgi:SOS response regulatory protein OraA/RecX